MTYGLPNNNLVCEHVARINTLKSRKHRLKISSVCRIRRVKRKLSSVEIIMFRHGLIKYKLRYFVHFPFIFSNKFPQTLAMGSVVRWSLILVEIFSDPESLYKILRIQRVEILPKKFQFKCKTTLRYWCRPSRQKQTITARITVL